MFNVLTHDAVTAVAFARAKEHNPQLTPDKLAMMIAGQFDREKGAAEFAVLKKLWAEDAA